jgi:hypothetical protein
MTASNTSRQQTQQQTIASAQQQQVTKTIIIQQQAPGQQPQTIHLQTPSKQQTSISSPTSLTLPNQTQTKEMLNINNGQITTQVVQPQPLNPATIPLPPSVASALQSINDQVTAKQNKVKLLGVGGGGIGVQQQNTIITSAAGQQSSVIMSPKQEQHQQIILQSTSDSSTSPTLNEGGSSNGPLFYYLMPGSAPYNLMSDGGSTIQVKTADGSLATAQLVTVPNNGVGSGNSASNTTNGITISNASSSSIPNWVIDTSSTTTSPRSNNPANNASSM